MISAAELGRRQSVYVAIGGPKHVKIGVSSDVQKRMAGIQTGCPFRVKLAKSWRTPFARKIEILAHHTLSRYRTAGEWFNVPIRAAIEIVETLIEAHPRNRYSRFYGAIVFCSWCRHSAKFDSEPELQAKLRCSKCKSREHVHVIPI